MLPVRDRAALERFVRLPMRLNAGDPHYVAPLIVERLAALSPKTNPFFAHAEAAFWLVRRDGRDVGRISAQVDSLAPADEGRRVGHFGMLAAEDDPTVFALLLRTVEAWLEVRGCTRVIGPLNLSINEEVGLLVEGFDSRPTVLMGHDPPYAGGRIEAQGYAKARDLYAYRIGLDYALPAGAMRRMGRGLPAGVRLRKVEMSRFDAEVAVLTDILNDAWSHNWGFTPTTEAETRALAKSIKPLIDPDLTWFAEIGGEPAGLIVLLPDLNEAIADLGGRLAPFGWAKLLWRLKVQGLSSLRIPLMGVRRRHEGTLAGQLLPFLLIERAVREAVRKGYRSAEVSWVLEDNLAMRHIAEAAGAVRSKTYRVYARNLG